MPRTSPASRPTLAKQPAVQPAAASWPPDTCKVPVSVHRVTQRTAIVLGALLAITACSEDPTIEFSTIRLIEKADAVTIDGLISDEEVPYCLREDFDSNALDDLAIHSASSLRAAGLGISPTVTGQQDRLIGEDEDRHLVLVPGSVLALSADIEASDAVEITARLWGEAIGSCQVGAFLIPTLPTDPDWLTRPKEVARHAAGRGFHRLTPSGQAGASRGQLYRAVIDPLRDAKGLMLVVWNAGGALHIDDVAVREVRWSADQAKDVTGTSDSAVQAITVGMDRRLAYVLPSGSTFRCTTPLPANGSRLSFSIAPLKRDRDSDLQVRVQVATPGGEPKTWEATLTDATTPLSGSWLDVEIDLGGLDPRTVTIKVEVSGAERGAAAFAEPTLIVPKPAEDLLPDVMLISLDTVRADRLSLYGHDRETSPRLAQLADQSCVFDHCIASSSWTLPSHVTLFTGQLPLRHGVRSPQHRIDPVHSPLLAVELRKIGYETLAFTGGGFVDPAFGFANGFDRYGTRDVGLPDRQFIKDLVGVPNEERREILGDDPLDHVLDVLRKEERHRPRFVFLHSYVAHNYQAFRDDLLAVGAREEEVDDLTNSEVVAALRGKDAAAAQKRARTEDEIRRLRLIYDATLRRADRLVGEVVDALEESGRLDQTYVIVTSDHGEALMEHGVGGHRGHLYEPVIRVPLLIRGPGVEPGRVSSVVSIADIAPTLRDALGLSLSEPKRDGRSLMEFLTGGREHSEPALAFADDGGVTRYALRGERWKLQTICSEGALREASLFDLLRDPMEADDRSKHEAKLVHQMSTALLRRIKTLEAAGASLDEGTLNADLMEELRGIGYVIGR